MDNNVMDKRKLAKELSRLSKEERERVSEETKRQIGEMTNEEIIRKFFVRASYHTFDSAEVKRWREHCWSRCWRAARCEIGTYPGQWPCSTELVVEFCASLVDCDLRERGEDCPPSCPYLVPVYSLLGTRLVFLKFLAEWLVHKGVDLRTWEPENGRLEPLMDPDCLYPQGHRGMDDAARSFKRGEVFYRLYHECKPEDRVEPYYDPPYDSQWQEVWVLPVIVRGPYKAIFELALRIRDFDPELTVLEMNPEPIWEGDD